MKKATAHESRDQANGYEVRAAASEEIVAEMDTKEKKDGRQIMSKTLSIRDCIGRREEFDVPASESYHGRKILRFDPLTEQFEYNGFWRSPVDVTVGQMHYSKVATATEDELLAIERAKASYRQMLAAKEELERVRVFFNRF